MLEIQTQKCHESWTGLSRKSYFIFVLQVLPQKRQLKIAVWFPWFYQNFRETAAIVIVVYQLRQQRCLAMTTSKRSKWNNSLGELQIIIHW